MGADEGRSGETNGEYQIQYHTNKHERRIKCTVHNQNNLANTLFKNIQEKNRFTFKEYYWKHCTLLEIHIQRDI